MPLASFVWKLMLSQDATNKLRAAAKDLETTLFSTDLVPQGLIRTNVRGWALPIQINASKQRSQTHAKSSRNFCPTRPTRPSA